MTATQCSMAFAPQLQIFPSYMEPIPTRTRVPSGSGIDDALSSSVLSRIRSRKTALNVSTGSKSKCNEESFPEYSNSDEKGQETTAVGGGLGDFNPDEKLGLERETANVGDPQTAQLEQPMNITKVLTELQAIQSQGPKKYCILGTRHCSFLHQQIAEMLAYALVLSGNHIYTSGAAGTNAAAIRGALRACQPQLLTVVLPQSMSKQTPESQELLQDVTNVVTMPQNDQMPLDVASRICNSHLLSQTDHLISFAFHESKTVLEAAQEAQKLDMLVTLLYLD
eukprot:CAMPEP_0183735304 /NCGR_PEP_ID=MMETSP0737-20130205/46254_1 /TAXON_ID=385413 /ORGANISM="Thalassiosira miniscula, Strain CCMP1093" /LENGTH=280 /DNA_ID=CAMNT_0025969003 /DNA_START=198 /DNA_END=1040 /DNA_ORIENTATION=+